LEEMGELGLLGAAIQVSGFKVVVVLVVVVVVVVGGGGGVTVLRSSITRLWCGDS